MDFSVALTKYLTRGSFPLFSSSDIRYWEELITKLETNAADTTQSVRDLINGKYGVLDKTYFGGVITINNVDITVSLSELGRLLGAMNSRLSDNHGLASRPPRQGFIQRLRVIALANNVIDESSVQLQPLDPGTKLGTGLVSPGGLTYIPDSALGVTFGSAPDQKAIAIVAPPWDILKRRTHERRPIAGQITVYGRKPHYVLAHLLNHNVNGSGADAQNVVPFFADANTEMANVAEKYLKELVLNGFKVDYSISLGPAVGMTAGRTQALADCSNDIQRSIIDIEQHLPSYFTITLKAWNGTAWLTIVNAAQINNYVPETVPVV
jgi:hypothetical protein